MVYSDYLDLFHHFNVLTFLGQTLFNFFFSNVLPFCWYFCLLEWYFLSQRNERESKLNCRPERPMLTKRSNDKVIHKFRECRPLRAGMDAGEWSRVEHFLPKGDRIFCAKWWIASDGSDPSRCTCRRPMAFTTSMRSWPQPPQALQNQRNETYSLQTGLLSVGRPRGVRWGLYIILRLDMLHVWNFRISENEEQATGWRSRWKRTTFMSGDKSNSSSWVVYTSSSWSVLSRFVWATPGNIIITRCV